MGKLTADLSANRTAAEKELPSVARMVPNLAEHLDLKWVGKKEAPMVAKWEFHWAATRVALLVLHLVAMTVVQSVDLMESRWAALRVAKRVY